MVADELGTFDEESASGGYELVEFQADAELIRELGERLVGADHIALAELVKNAYDADATLCSIKLEGNRIIVSDNGNGMRDDEFRNFWMRIGSTHKRERGTSKRFRRNVTGSKGVGRLSAQFLAHRMQLVTVAEDDPSHQAVHALIDWDSAVTAGDLTSAKALFRVEPDARVSFPEDSSNGTTVILEGLKRTWGEADIKRLGQQLWMLNSPLPRFGRLADGGAAANNFVITFQTTLPGLDSAFERQMRAAIDAYYAVIDGELRREQDKCISTIRVRFRNGETYSETFEHEPLIKSANWQVRVYDLVGRQPSGVPVDVARRYFEQFGVMMFDAGFRLPYYGAANDWLGIERDHAGRLSRSKLLPDRLQTTRGLNDLPTQDRLLGVVVIDTGSEERSARELALPTDQYLQILVTRDRLVENSAFRTLNRAVRQSLDLYATRERSRTEIVERAILPLESPATKLRRIDGLVREVVDRYPFDDAVAVLREEIQSLDLVVEETARADDAARALLGPLASAGMAALAMEHENRKEIGRARSKLTALLKLAEDRDDAELERLVADLQDWLTRFEEGRKVFAPLIEADDRERVEELPAYGTVREIVANVAGLIQPTKVQIDVPRELVLPPATFAEWHALFQNVLINASNAMLDEAHPRVLVTGGQGERQAWLRFSDIGTGVDLAAASELFQPFKRKQEISRDRMELGLGGTGLGLTIVRMIANQRGCACGFVEPREGWQTAFEISWAI